jgi:hypothetical protein
MRRILRAPVKNNPKILARRAKSSKNSKANRIEIGERLPYRGYFNYDLSVLSPLTLSLR